MTDTFTVQQLTARELESELVRDRELSPWESNCLAELTGRVRELEQAHDYLVALESLLDSPGSLSLSRQ